MTLNYRLTLLYDCSLWSDKSRFIQSLLGLLLTLGIPVTFSQTISPIQQDVLRQSPVVLLSKNLSFFDFTTPYYPFLGRKNAIIRFPKVLEHLKGINRTDQSDSIALAFTEKVYVLLALPENIRPQQSNAQLYLDSAFTITGLSPYKIYRIPYNKGKQVIALAHPDGFITGVISAKQRLVFQNTHLPDGRLWRPYLTDGLSDDKRLFEIIGGADYPVIDEGMPDTEGIQGGFEGGTCVKVGNLYHLFPTERAGEIGVAAYHDRVKTRIGHWESSDAIHWKRASTIFESSGNYALVEEDNPMNDRRGAIWSFNAVFNTKEDRWYGYYLTYTVDRNIRPNHSFGRIWCTKSQTKGINGIGGPYNNGQLIMEPGLDSQPWEGRQGVASFYPYPVGKGWLGFYSGAFPFQSWADYPKKTSLGWYIGLAKSSSMDGPWVRLDTTINPVKTINPQFVENPIVNQLDDGTYVAVFDGGPDGGSHHFANMIGYSISTDGLHWSEARYIPIHTKVNRWWSTMRTPMCLISEGNHVFTIVYAAFAEPNKRFHPIGMVKLKMNMDVLTQLKKQ